MEIIKLNASHAHSVFNLFKEELGSIAWSLADTEKALNNPNMAYYGIFVGETLASCISLLVGLDNIEILDVATKMEHKRKGLAQKLIKFVLSLRNHEQTLSLEVSTNNAPAINLYKKMNFKIIRTIKKFYSNGEDAFSMMWSLPSNDE